LSVPAAPPQGGPCYPIVLYSHGTGGSAYGMINDDTAGRLAARGLAGLAIDQPLHGTRDGGLSFDVVRMSFNFLNPESARAVFRQSVIDDFSRVRFVRESLRVPAEVSPTGGEICFDEERLAFFGHSHGGITGAMLAAFEDTPRAYVLSGAGGVLAITIMERKDYIDVEEVLRLFFIIDEDEELSELHPTLTLIQTIVDVTDPINYAPAWLSGELSFPKHVLMTAGAGDTATHHRTATALALAGGLDIVAPIVLPSEAYEIAGSSPVEAPVSGNRHGVTAGVLQYAGGEDEHDLAFERPEAIHATMEFLRTGTAGSAVIERDTASTAR
jgi:hypothetical protein